MDAGSAGGAFCVAAQLVHDFLRYGVEFPGFVNTVVNVHADEITEHSDADTGVFRGMAGQGGGCLIEG